jgi:hypothetical protein
MHLSVLIAQAMNLFETYMREEVITKSAKPRGHVTIPRQQHSCLQAS